jgi:hypothetical protein
VIAPQGLAAAGFDIRTVAYEDITRFEYFSDPTSVEWQQSEDAFITMLRGLGLPAKKFVVRDVMHKLMPKDAAGNYVTRRCVHACRGFVLFLFLFGVSKATGYRQILSGCPPQTVESPVSRGSVCKSQRPTASSPSPLAA